METKQSMAWRYAAIAAIAAIAGGVVALAFAPDKNELNQLRVQRDALATDVRVLNEQIGPLRVELRSLGETNAARKSEIDRLTTALAEREAARVKASGVVSERERAVATFEDRNRALAAENETMRKKLASMGEKMEATAAERAALAGKLDTTGQSLQQARARAADLNKSYETLLAEKTTLAERAAARRSEIEITKKAFEEAQAEVARLTGARGIYTVQNGDSLSTIAAFFYRNGLRWPDIFKENSFLVSRPDLIYPRQVLIIPQ